jgi:hypothetical protein
MVAAGTIVGIAPQFLVDDLDRSIAYYRDRRALTSSSKTRTATFSVSANG